MDGRMTKNSFGTRAELATTAGPIYYYRLATLEDQGVAAIERLPFSIRVLLEALLRTEVGSAVSRDDVHRLACYKPQQPGQIEIPFMPARVLLQDFTGVPCLVDLAAMRSALARLGRPPARINPGIPVDLVVDHSLQVDAYNSPQALEHNSANELERNRERYEFLRWGQQALRGVRVIPPGRGMCHQINLEYLAPVVQCSRTNGSAVAFFDAVVGTDSHTTMINGLGVVGWGVGGIEAEAVMLGQPLYMLAPPVVGVKLTGRLPQGCMATDLVLTITQLLRARGVVGAFVEFYGPDLAAIPVPDRATIANMAPEYGATMGFFPVDEQTLAYLRLTGRPPQAVALVESYCRAQGLLRTADTPAPDFHETLEIDLGRVQPSVAGPSRPQDRIDLRSMQTAWRRTLALPAEQRGFHLEKDQVSASAALTLPDGSSAKLAHGSVVLAAITSCTNTSNPAAMLAAGLLAKKAAARGLRVKPWVKTSIAPGSRAVTAYLRSSGLLAELEQVGFFIVGYGCAICIGNSGPLAPGVLEAAERGRLVVASVISGNRNFEGRIHPQVRACFLASPALVVAYALAGTVDIDLAHEPLGRAPDGAPVFLADLWPADAEIAGVMAAAVRPDMFRTIYTGIEESHAAWNRLTTTTGDLFAWQTSSTYIQEPPFFTDLQTQPARMQPIQQARVLLLLGSSITTDHISPAGPIAVASPAGSYLQDQGVGPDDFSSYGSRRGNHHVMVRGTFAHRRLRNLLAPGTEGGRTIYLPTGEQVSVYEAAMRYQAAGIPTLVIAGRDYGMGSSRDWAAKGTRLLGIRAVLAESFERIHRSNLVCMGVLPLQFKPGDSAPALGLTGHERYTIAIDDMITPGQDIAVDIEDASGRRASVMVTCRLDTATEIDYYRNGGILQSVLRRFLS